MKLSINILLFLFYSISFAQEKNNGTVKIKKIESDTCIGSVLGYCGTNTITRNELLKINKIDLNDKCNCEIISFVLSYQTSYIKAIVDFEENNLKNNIPLKDYENMTFLRISNILINDKDTKERVTLPAITFKIIN